MVTESANLAVDSSGSLYGERYRIKETLDLRHYTRNIRLLAEFVYFI